LARHGHDSGAIASPDGVTLEASTTVPESVGLAGSSALVVAAMRALAARWGFDLDVVTLAWLARETESGLLGIAGGPQDPLVQAAERTVLMDFGGETWSVEPIDPPEPVELFVVWSTAAAEASQTVHGPLQARRGEREVVAAMQRLAELARAGAAALANGDLAGLGAAMDGSFEARASVIDLAPAHVALVEGARSTGAHANYAGSGGAIVGMAPGGCGEAERWAGAEGFGFRRMTLRPPGTTSPLGS
jgi:glucuronokinase